MNRSNFALLLACGLLGSQTALAQETAVPVAGRRGEASQENHEQEWHYDSTHEKKTLGRQKAELRGRQRTARLESLRWLGLSASRPTAAGHPFTSSMYGPSWGTPRHSGRSFYGWHTTRRPVVVISPYYPAYYR